MNKRNLASLCRQIGGQSVWGKRGIIKTGTVWLPLAIMSWQATGAELAGRGVTYLLLFLAAVCRTQAAILGNDIADCDEDQAAGKLRWICGVPRGSSYAIVAALVALGIVILLFAGAPPAAQLVFFISSALGISYSARPLRFKARGAHGPLAFSLSCSSFYVLVPWFWFSRDTALLVVLFPAVFLDKWANLHFHQVVDYEADRAQGTETCVVRTGLQRGRRTLRRFAWLASMAMIALLALLLSELTGAGRIAILLALIAVAAAAGHASRAFHRASQPSALIKELPPLYLGLAFGVLRILPPLLFIPLAFDNALLSIPAGLSVATTFADSWFFSRYRYL